MIDKIMDPTGIPYANTQFSRAPAGNYAVWMDDIETDGPDGINRIFRHNISLELYTPKAAPEAEEAIESQLNALGLRWTKQARYWLPLVTRYQTFYEFTYIEKRR